MDVPLAGYAIYSEDALTSFNESKIERAGQFTKKYVYKKIWPDSQTQCDGRVCTVQNLHRVNKPYTLNGLLRFGVEIIDGVHGLFRVTL